MLYVLVGLMGSVLMFCGDMILYYTPEDFDYESGTEKNKMQAVIDVMKNLPVKRVAVGGLIGPIAAFLYCIGFYHIIKITNGLWHVLGVAAFLFLCMGIIAGGAYHSHCAYLGLLGDDKYKDSRDIVLKYFSKLALVLYGGAGIGFLLLIILIVTGNTMLPRWFFIITPGMLFLLKPLVSRLPKGVRVIISGGWSNLISVIYFSSVLFSGII